MPSALSARAAAALEAIEHLGTQDLSTQRLMEEIVLRIGRVVPADGFFAGATDPDTGYVLGAGLAYNYSAEVCRPFWEHEHLIPDFNKFADLGPDHPVADLRRATGNRLSRSARYRMLNGISGFEDEVRAVFHAGGRPWGKLQLNRLAGGRPFTEDELEFLRAIGPVAGAALRRSLLEEPAGTDPGRGPGVVILDQEGAILSATDEAAAWLDELAVSWDRIDADILIRPDLLLLALATLEHGASRRVRLRTHAGTWLVAHASPLRAVGQVALVLEPAKASEIAPIVIEAYCLTPREVEVTRLVARGLSTDEIAGRLFLSRHTVRDHLKAIFEKVGVSSRGELTSRLFAEHYQPVFDDAVHEAYERVDAKFGALPQA